MEHIKGDCTYPVGSGVKLIIHCCNDLGVWGAGFVLALSHRWPCQDINSPEDRYLEWSLAGYSSPSIPLELEELEGPDLEAPFQLGQVQFVEAEKDLWVANLIGQHGVGRGKVPPIRYEAIQEGLKACRAFCLDHKATAHFPKFGAGLAGGSWDRIKALIDQELVNHQVGCVCYVI